MKPSTHYFLSRFWRKTSLDDLSTSAIPFEDSCCFFDRHQFYLSSLFFLCRRCYSLAMRNQADYWTLLICILLLEEEEQQEEEQQELSFRQCLDHHSRRMRSGAIRRGALQAPSKSAFQYLFKSGQDDALVTLCGFDHQSFATINALFDVEYRQYSPFTVNGQIRRRPLRNRRRRLLSSIQCLGLVLAWTRTRGQYSVLQLIFGITKGHLSLWLRFGRRLLIKFCRTTHSPKFGYQLTRRFVNLKVPLHQNTLL